EEVIKGRVGETCEVVELGGTSDGLTYLVAGAPHYAPSERVLLMLETNDRGDWTAKNMILGKFAFDGELLVRDASEIGGWDVGGAPHVERARHAEPFLRYVRAIAKGNAASVDYYAARAESPRHIGNATPSINSYLL